MEFNNVLANSQESIFEHTLILIVHANANCNFDLSIGFNLAEKIIRIIIATICQISGELSSELSTLCEIRV